MYKVVGICLDNFLRVDVQKMGRDGGMYSGENGWLLQKGNVGGKKKSKASFKYAVSDN